MPVLTKRLVSSARPRSKKYEITCSALRGFVLRVLPSGKKVYFARYQHDGKDTRQRIGLATDLSFEEARARAGQLLSRTAALSQPRAERPTERPVGTTPYLRDFAWRFTSGHIEIAIKPATASTYRLSLKNHIIPRFGATRLGDITREDVETWVGTISMQHPQAGRTANAVLSCLFTKAVQWRALPSTHVIPTRGVRLKPARMRDRFLTPDERAHVEQILQRGLETPRARKGHLHWGTVYAIRLLALTGMRSAEVFTLRWHMVDLTRRVFRLPDSKTGQKIVPFSQAVLKILEEIRALGTEECPWVLESSITSGHVAKSSVGNAWRRIRKTAGLGDDIRIHDLRHSFASDAAMSGVPLAVIGKVLGHKSPRITARYAHVSNEVVADALERTSARILDAQSSRPTTRTRKPKSAKPRQGPRRRRSKS